MLYPTPIAKLIDSYSKLPGIGIKTATRLAFYTIGMSDDDVNEFAKIFLQPSENWPIALFVDVWQMMILVLSVPILAVTSLRFWFWRIAGMLLLWKTSKNTTDFTMFYTVWFPYEWD